MFERLPPSKLKLLAFTSELVTYEHGDLLFQQGDNADSAYLIVDGEAEILSEAGSGPVVVGVLVKNELVGEMGVLTNSPRSASIRAKDGLKTLKIDGEVFVKLITENPTVALDVMRQLSDKLARTHRRYEMLESELQDLRQTQ